MLCHFTENLKRMLMYEPLCAGQWKGISVSEKQNPGSLYSDQSTALSASSKDRHFTLMESEMLMQQRSYEGWNAVIHDYDLRLF